MIPSSSQQAKRQATISSFFAPKSSQPQSHSQNENKNEGDSNQGLSQSALNSSQTAPSRSPVKSSAPTSSPLPASTKTKSRTPLANRISETNNTTTRTRQTPSRRPARTRNRAILDEDDEEVGDGHIDEEDTDDDAPEAILPRIKRARVGSSPIRGHASSDMDLDFALDTKEGDIPEPDAAPSLLPPSSRTSKYLFSSSPAVTGLLSTVDHPEETEQDKRRREKLHEKFVKKLGKPDSLLELRRNKRGAGGVGADDENNGEDDSEAAADGMGEDNEDEEELTRPAKKTRGSGKKTGSKLTPLEKQVLDVKKQHPDTLLVVEVGYKFRFFGEDARIASRELGIMCIPGKMRYDEHPSEAHLDRFASASIPTHRLHVHVKRLVSAGHKVGVVRQLETAALKAAGDNRGGPFVRKLTNLYTKATYVDDLEGLDDGSSEQSVMSNGATSSGYILCLIEGERHGLGADEKVKLGFVAVHPATGDVVYDTFTDAFMRVELETRLLHIAPAEFIIVGDLSPSTERLITHLTTGKSNVFGDQARIERVEKTKTLTAEAFSRVTNLYADRLANGSGSVAESKTMDVIHNLPDDVTVCLSVLIDHLTEYGLEHVFDLTKYFTPFSSRSHMLLNANTLSSLEVYQNQTDFSSKGSLFWCLDRTKTRFGQRLLRKWVGRPLLDRKLLQERLDAVEELASAATSSSLALTTAAEKLRTTISQVKWDLEKTLLRLHYQKSSRPELYGMLETLRVVGSQYRTVFSGQDSGFTSPLIGSAISSLSTIHDITVDYLSRIQPFAARRDDKSKFFHEQYETAAMTEHKSGIQEFEARLNQHRFEAAKVVGKTSIQYVSVAGIDYLIELDNKLVNGKTSKVPASWIKISGTKKVSRFHSPEIVTFLRKRDEHKEALEAACESAFLAFLKEIGEKHYQVLKECVQSIAVLDCLLSLAEVASQEGYVKPSFPDVGPDGHVEIDIKGARHPMVERLMLDPYVPNDVCLRNGPGRNEAGQARHDITSETGSSQDLGQPVPTTATPIPSTLLITGPNMGGKSSFVRSIALLCLMAQLGSFIPATSASLPVLDAIYTRMGASDNLLKGESTFLVEVSETAEILRSATNRSLVILDELGRGTSTHDGYAIAEAVVREFVEEVGAMVLFVTHYQGLGRLEGEMNGWLRNVHMRFEEVEICGGGGGGSGGGDNAGDVILDSANQSDTAMDVDKPAALTQSSSAPTTALTFLYQVTPGMAHRSYGLNVARLANLPVSVIEQAAKMSRQLERVLERRKLDFIVHSFEKIEEKTAAAAAGGGEDGARGAEADGEMDADKWVDAFVGAVGELAV